MKTTSPKSSFSYFFIFRPITSDWAELTGTLDGAKLEGLICSDPRFYFKFPFTENLACPAVIKGGYNHQSPIVLCYAPQQGLYNELHFTSNNSRHIRHFWYLIIPNHGNSFLYSLQWWKPKISALVEFSLHGDWALFSFPTPDNRQMMMGTNSCTRSELNRHQNFHDIIRYGL
jgi:hypothetical protein